MKKTRSALLCLSFLSSLCLGMDARELSLKLNLADSYKQSGQYQQAIEVYREIKALPLTEETLPAWSHTVDAYIQLRDDAAADKAAEELMSRAKGTGLSERASSALFGVFLRNKKDEKLLITAQEARTPSELYRLGLCYWHQDRDDEAWKVFMRIRDNWPDSLEGSVALLRLSEIAWERKDLEQAEQFLYEIAWGKGCEKFEQEHVTAIALQNLGLLYQGKGLLEQAVEQWETLVKRFPLNYEAQCIKGRLLEAKKSLAAQQAGQDQKP